MELPKSLTTVTTLSRILAGVLFVSLPFIGFYLGMKYQASLSPRVATPRIVPTSVETPTTTSDPTANWEMYSSKLFSFKYPSSLFTITEGDGCVKLKASLAYLAIKLPGGAIYCGQTGRGAYDIVTDVNETANIGGQQYTSTLGYTIDSSKDPDAKTKVSEFFRFEDIFSKDLYIEYGGYFNDSDKTNYENEKKVINQILSTFRFIASPYEENNLPETSIRTIQHSVIPSWETYSNEFTGLTLQYPPGFRQISEEKQGKECVLSFGNDAGGVLYVKIVPYNGGSRRELYGINTGYTYSFEDVYIQGLKSLIIEAGPIGDSGSGSGIVIPKGKNALIISISNRAKDDEWFQNILKSIEITELTGACG